jgi:hypothetical protein
MVAINPDTASIMTSSTKRKKTTAMWSDYLHSIASALQQSTEENHGSNVHTNIQNTLYDSDASAFLWNIPDTILFGIISFVAAPTHRAGVVCHQLAPLNHNCYERYMHNTSLWEAILQEDYGAISEDCDKSIKNVRRNNANGSDKRRRCTRLERSPLERVQEAHRLVKDNTEIAFYYLSELVTASTSKAGLSHRKLLSLLQEYGPHLRINQRTATGGLFLVEVCRSKNIKEPVVLKCVQELVEHHGALVNLQTYEAVSVYQTALAVVSARGMPSVVKYLLSKGACPKIRSSGSFRLSKNPKKSLRLVNLNCLECASEAKKGELEHGATARDLKALNKCIELLEVVIKEPSLVNQD